MRDRRLLLGLAFSLALLFPVRLVSADFKLLDAIEEFGEKRSLKTLPARIKAGPVRVHPTLRNRATYDSNILLEDDDEREDVVFNIQPGAIVEVPFQRHQVSVGYEADIEVFSKSRHARQSDQNQNAFVLADLNFPSWYVNVLERFAETSGRSGTTFTERNPRYDQSIHPKAGYHWKRATFEMGFRHFARDFRRDVQDALDFQLVEWTGVIYYDLFAKLKALVDYQVAQIDYDDNRLRNGTFQQTRIGLQGEILPNVAVKVAVGPHFRNYAISSKPNFNSWVMDSSIAYEMRKDLKFNAGFSREPVEANFGNVNYYVEHGFNAGVEYSPWKKWALFSDYRYRRHHYRERATLNSITAFRRDHTSQVTAGLRYRMREWLEWELAYDLRDRDSNFSTLDYLDHRVTLSSSLAY